MSDLRVVRLCSVFEPPAAVLRGRGARFDPIGGMQNHTACLTRALDARGVRQDVVTTRPPGAPRAERVAGRATVHRHGLPVRALRQGYAPFAAVQVHRLARRADLVHAHLGEDLAVAPIALSAARRAGVPVVLTLHLSLAHTLSGAGARTALLRRLGGAIERHGIGRADAVIVLTRRLADRLRAAGLPHDRVHVVPSGVVPEDFAAPNGHDPLAGIPRPRVVFVGRLAAQKGVTTLVEAAARLTTPGATVVLVGDGPQRALLERRVVALGLQDRVRFHGFVAHGEVPAVLRHTDVQVLPSVYEELGSVLLEGMQAGVPIVATRTGGIPEAVGPAAELVAPEDPAGLAQAIDRVLTDPVRAAALAARGSERARRFDWSVLAGRIHELYEDLAGRAAPAAAPERVPALA